MHWGWKLSTNSGEVYIYVVQNIPAAEQGWNHTEDRHINILPANT